MEEKEALVILNNTPYVGALKIRALIDRFGSAVSVLSADSGELAKVPGMGVKSVDSLVRWEGNTLWRALQCQNV